MDSATEQYTRASGRDASPAVRERLAMTLARRRPAYAACCGIGLVATALSWAFLVADGHGTSLDVVLLPVIAVSLVVSIVLLLGRRTRTETIELVLLVVAATSLLSKVTDIFFFVHRAGHHDIAPLGDVLPWLAVVPVLGVVVFRVRRWAVVSITFYGAIAALGAVHVAPGLAAGDTAVEAYVLARTLLGNTLLTGLLAIGTRFHAGFLNAIAQAEAMRTLALTDALTALPNRRSVADAMQRELARSRRYGHELAVVMFDLDHFKRVNDAHGHAGGDRALQAVAGCVRGAVRGADLVGRWGGEEFLVLAPETGEEGARRLAEKLRAAVEALSPDGLGVLTASWGVATLAPGDTTESLVARADSALYDAKARGRNRVVAADPPSTFVLGAALFPVA